MAEPVRWSQITLPDGSTYMMTGPFYPWLVVGVLPGQFPIVLSRHRYSDKARQARRKSARMWLNGDVFVVQAIPEEAKDPT